MDSRTRLLEATTALLADRGYHGTGMKDILCASQVVAGSLYHHFPGGKDELAAACVARAADEVAARMEANLSSRPPVDAVRAFYAAASAALVATDYRSGCPVGTPAAETRTLAGPVAAAVADAFVDWEGALTRGLESHGWPEDEARATASVLLSLYEGALLVARAERTTAPLDVAARHSCAIVAARPDPAEPSPATSAGP